MAVGGIFTKTNVGYNEELGKSLAQETNAGHDGAFRVVGGGSKGIFNIWCNWNPKKYDRPKTLADERFEEGNDFIDAAAVLIGK